MASYMLKPYGFVEEKNEHDDWLNQIKIFL
jgi:hypothetical protein